ADLGFVRLGGQPALLGRHQYQLYSKAFSRHRAAREGSVKVPRGDEPRGKRASPPPVSSPPPRRPRRPRGETPPCAPPVSIPRTPRAGHHLSAAPLIRDSPGNNNPARVREC